MPRKMKIICSSCEVSHRNALQCIPMGNRFLQYDFFTRQRFSWNELHSSCKAPLYYYYYFSPLSGLNYIFREMCISYHYHAFSGSHSSFKAPCLSNQACSLFPFQRPITKQKQLYLQHVEMTSQTSFISLGSPTSNDVL